MLRLTESSKSQPKPQSGGEKPLPTVKLKLAEGYDWDISPDGRRIAFVHNDPSDHLVHFLTLADGSMAEVAVPGWSGFSYVAWAADGTGLYVAANLPKIAALLRLDLNGKISVLWKNQLGYLELSVPSPDGRHIAFTVGIPGESNAWILKEF
jgi:Tol biopolymer transport system component